MEDAKIPKDRILSIDVLRGFDMFFLVGAGDILRRLFKAFNSESVRPILDQLSHRDWIGFTAWDIIMPLFLFTAGLSMPFSFSKLQETKTKKEIYWKVLKRFAKLFVLGWIAQGNLLDLDPDTFHIFSNTLQAIAIGYLISAILILNIHKVKIQLIVSVALVLVYALLLTFAPVPGFGSGVFTPEGNFAIYVDHLVLGKLDDGTQYTWILSSLAFTGTVMSGYFAGLILKSQQNKVKILKLLIIWGCILVAGGLLWSIQMPIIKKIWSPSMVLYSSGISFLLLAFFHLIVDIWKVRAQWVTVLRYFGLNSITAYILSMVFNLRAISAKLLHGFEQYTDAFFPLIVAAGEFAILWFIIWHMYKYKIFLKV